MRVLWSSWKQVVADRQRPGKAVQAALPDSIRACSYDRAGSGKSDPGPEPRTMDAEVGDLHALLERLNIAEPIVFVGQSLGGILGRLFVQEYPHSVAGTEQWLEMRSSRDGRVKELSKLSRNSKFILDSTSGHNIEHDNPKLVADVIQQLVNEILSSRKLGQ